MTPIQQPFVKTANPFLKNGLRQCVYAQHQKAIATDESIIAVTTFCGGAIGLFIGTKYGMNGNFEERRKRHYKVSVGERAVDGATCALWGVLAGAYLPITARVVSVALFFHGFGLVVDKMSKQNTDKS